MTATIEIRAPSEQTEGTRSQVQRWLKSVGDAVVLGVAVDELRQVLPQPMAETPPAS